MCPYYTIYIYIHTYLLHTLIDDYGVDYFIQSHNTVACQSKNMYIHSMHNAVRKWLQFSEKLSLFKKQI